MSRKEIPPDDIIILQKSQDIEVDQSEYTLENPSLTIKINKELINEIQTLGSDYSENNLFLSISVDVGVVPDVLRKEVNIKNLYEPYEINLLDWEEINKNNLVHGEYPNAIDVYIFSKSNNKTVVSWASINLKDINPFTDDDYPTKEMFKAKYDENLKTLWEIRYDETMENRGELPHIYVKQSAWIELTRISQNGEEKYKQFRLLLNPSIFRECFRILLSQTSIDPQDAVNDVKLVEPFLRSFDVPPNLIAETYDFPDNNDLTPAEKRETIDKIVNHMFQHERMKEYLEKSNNTFIEELKNIYNN